MELSSCHGPVCRDVFCVSNCQNILLSKGPISQSPTPLVKGRAINGPFQGKSAPQKAGRPSSHWPPPSRTSHPRPFKCLAKSPKSAVSSKPCDFRASFFFVASFLSRFYRLTCPKRKAVEQGPAALLTSRLIQMYH